MQQRTLVQQAHRSNEESVGRLVCVLWGGPVGGGCRRRLSRTPSPAVRRARALAFLLIIQCLCSGAVAGRASGGGPPGWLRQPVGRSVRATALRACTGWGFRAFRLAIRRAAATARKDSGPSGLDRRTPEPGLGRWASESIRGL